MPGSGAILGIKALKLAPFASRYSVSGMVCAVDHLAAGAGIAMMRAGGSSADAAVAASAVLAVTNQHMCGMGGDLFAVVHSDGLPPVALNASGRAGSGADPDALRSEGHAVMPLTSDIRSVPVPGCVDGWLELHGRFGRLALAQVLEPARLYAAEGFAAAPGLVEAVGRVAGLPGADDFRGALMPGAIIRRPGVARVLSAIAQQGRAGFYCGEFGEGLFSLGKGEYTAEDLETPCSDWVAPLSVDAFGARIWTAPPNSQGYITLAGAWIADGLDLPRDTRDPLWAHLTIEAARQAAFDRDDVLHEQADGDWLVSPQRLAARRGAISRDKVAPARGNYARGDTVYLCAIDEDRLAVSLIQSNASEFGALLAERNTGIFLQNRGAGFSLQIGHPAEYRPRRRPPHTLSPTLVTSRDNRLRAALGTMGGDAQPQILLQLLGRILRSKEAVGDAVAAARWVLSSAQKGGGVDTAPLEHVELEPMTPTSWTGQLQARGHLVATSRSHGQQFGHAQVIACLDGCLEGASDPRSLSGAAAGY